MFLSALSRLSQTLVFSLWSRLCMQVWLEIRCMTQLGWKSERYLGTDVFVIISWLFWSLLLVIAIILMFNRKGKNASLEVWDAGTWRITLTHIHTLTENPAVLRQALIHLFFYFHFFHFSSSFTHFNSPIGKESPPVVKTYIVYTSGQTVTHTDTHTKGLYWTLRVRADTPWCQSLSSLYLGPITNRVVGLFDFDFLDVSPSASWACSVPVIWARILKDLDWVVPVRGRQSSVSSIMRFLLASAWVGMW